MPLTSGTYSNNESQIYQILLSNGFNLAQTCGILANIEDESGYNPTASNSKEGAYGLCQWRQSRKTSLFSKYTSKPSVYNQIRHVIDELNGEDSIAKGCLNGLPNTVNGAYDAGFAFASKFERCAVVHRPSRAQRAQVYWNYYNNGGSSLTPSVDLKIPEVSENISHSVPTYGSQVTVGNLEHILNNLSKVTASNDGYGHLIDMTYGGEFKFYIPEFQESAGTQWEDINIPGRSVSIKSYQYTNSRRVTISLDLYAGVGLYSGNSDIDVVSALHADANFVKSLEYPDYSVLGVAQPPAQVHLILGNAFNMEGVVSDVNVEHLKPLDDQGRAMYIKLTFSVTQNVLNPPSWSDIRNGITAVTTSANNPERFYKDVIGNTTGKNGMPSNVPNGGTQYEKE